MKVLVVDDHPLVIKGIISILSCVKDIERIEEASNVDEAMEIISKIKPEITIIDLYLGREDGLEIVDRARKNHFQSKFIVLTSSSRKEDFERARDMDVDGYILKEAFAEDIIYAFKVIAKGRKFYDSLMIEPRFRMMETAPFDELTKRELDVLKGIGKGMSNQQIAKELFISEHTVKKHVSSILNKLGMKHRTEAAIKANQIFNGIR
ncbi:MAG: response regulator transcription factor [Clostridiaceae bacterium]|nr:response regulator transcription factor [Clostridiaceae bacterium]